MIATVDTYNNTYLHVVLNAIDKGFLQLPDCSDQTDGICIERPPSGKGVVIYSNYEHCSYSMIDLPGINLLPTWLLGVMWALFLLWLFFGVAAISDVFVEAIEVITSKTKTIKTVDTNGKEVEQEVPVWNWAVANITLLSIGSSSPEILLAFVECILTLGQPPSNLGAACIIGSGSYNLFAITAVCTLSIPAGTMKKIEHTKVFWWTTSWSMWAHLWLWLVYKQISPEAIEIWEAVVTLGFMPLFVFTTYLVDTRGFSWFGPSRYSNAVMPTDSNDDDLESPKGVGNASLQDPNKQYRSILYYRSLAVQKMAGVPGTTARLVQSPSMAVQPSGPSSNFTIADLESMGKSVQKVFIKSPDYSVLESMGEARVQVVRMHGDLNTTLRVSYTCKDDTAVAGLDYVMTEGTLIFEPGQESAFIIVKIVDDDMSEPDVMFSVHLTVASIDGGDDVMLLRRQTTVTIVDDDDGGVLVFELPTFEAGIQDEFAEVQVIRRNGADGKVTIDYATKDGSAIAGKHYKQSQGTLSFEGGQTRSVIQVPLLAFDSPDLVAGTLAFRLTLSNPGGGVILGSRFECRVVLVAGSKFSKIVRESKGVRGHGEGDEEEEEEEEFNLSVAWRNQFQDAILPEYDPEEGNLVVAMVLQFITFTWKVLCACIPPPEWKSGYPCLAAALSLLALTMVIVKEVAHMLGCSMGLSDLMTGMSIVALGTSLPDTFASQYAAIHDEGADAAIGNIMGSNSVNVLLGLGIPWTISSIYYKLVDGTPYYVIAGSLGFAVMIFFILAAVAIAILLIRRQQGGELGAMTRNMQLTLFSTFIGIWMIFLMLSGLFDYGWIPDAGF